MVQEGGPTGLQGRNPDHQTEDRQSQGRRALLIDNQGVTCRRKQCPSAALT